MRADAQQFRHPFDGAGGVQDDASRDGLIKPLGQVGQQHRRSLHADQVRDRQPGLAHLAVELPGRWQKPANEPGCTGGSSPIRTPA